MARKKKTDEDETNNINPASGNDSDDTFGLPDVEYKPLNREEAPASTTEEPTEVAQPVSPQYEYQQKPMEQNQNQNPEYTYEPEEEEAPVWPKVFAILLIIGLALGAAWYFVLYKPAQEKIRIAKEQKELAEKQEQERLAEAQRLRDAEAQRVADSLANVSKVGMIETLSERTGRYYVVAASAVDDDLLMDHAKKLSTQGISTKIIPPFGKYKFYRLTIADGDTFASAQEVANTKKADFGEAVWVLKY